MIFGQDFAREWHWILLSWGCIVCCYIALQGLMQMDLRTVEETKFCKVSFLWEGLLCFISSICVCFICVRSVLHIILLSLVASCLLLACVMDVETHMVYNYVWCVGGAVGVILIILSDSNRWLSVILFVLLQELFFCKMYGRADCHGFSLCALVEAVYGMGVRGYLLHMLLSFGLLAIVQLLKDNISGNGNLKKPVPFLPYIVVAFWISLVVYLCV